MHFYSSAHTIHDLEKTRQNIKCFFCILQNCYKLEERRQKHCVLSLLLSLSLSYSISLSLLLSLSFLLSLSLSQTHTHSLFSLSFSALLHKVSLKNSFSNTLTNIHIFKYLSLTRILSHKAPVSLLLFYCTVR